jgi:hypothetical protein
VLLKKLTFLGDNADLILVIMSITILVTSLFITNKNFKGRALVLKAHYIELQRLYFVAVDAEEKSLDQKGIQKDYLRLLEAVENHSEMDDIIFRVFNESGLNSRKPSNNEKFRAYLYKTRRFITLATLYLLPIIMISIVGNYECI